MLGEWIDVVGGYPLDCYAYYIEHLRCYKLVESLLQKKGYLLEETKCSRGSSFSCSVLLHTFVERHIGKVTNIPGTIISINVNGQ